MTDTPHIILTIAGKEKKFRFDLNALSDFQSVTGIKLSEFVELEDRIEADIGVLIAIIWAGLYQHDRDLTRIELGRILKVDEIAEIKGNTWEHIASALGLNEKKVTRATPKKTTVANRGPGNSPSKKQQS